jgi:hypothetical protein
VNREATEERDALIGHSDDAYRSGGDTAESRIHLDWILAKIFRPHRQPGFESEPVANAMERKTQ